VASTKNRHNILEILFRISNLINTTVDRQKVLNGIMKEVVKVTGATSGSIAMFDREAGILNIETAIGIPKSKWKTLKLHLGVGVTGWAAYDGKPLLVDDVRKDLRYVAIKQDVRSELAVPMFLKRKMVGVINVDSKDVAAFTEEHKQILLVIAEQAARVIETSQLYEHLQDHTNQITSLFRLNRLITKQATVNQLQAQIADEAFDLIDWDSVMVFLYDQENEQLKKPDTRGIHKINSTANSCPIEKTIFVGLVKHGAPIVLSETREPLTIWQPEPEKLKPVEAMIAFPISSGRDLFGVLCFVNQKPKQISNRDLQLTQIMASQTALVFENAKRREQLSSLEETLHQTERFSLLGTFAAEMAHEIRNPLTIINLMLESVSADLSTDHAKKDMANIREKIQRIENIVDQTLDLSRSAPIPTEAISINNSLRELILFLQYKLEKSRIQVTHSFSKSLHRVLIDSGQFQQVMLNLIVNAIDSMPDGGTISISTRNKEENSKHFVTITIKDSGCGMSVEDREKLFEPFYTTKANGTGLGLFISHKIVHKFGGKLSVNSKQGKGSTFRLVLPAEVI